MEVNFVAFLIIILIKNLKLTFLFYFLKIWKSWYLLDKGLKLTSFLLKSYGYL